MEIFVKFWRLSLPDLSTQGRVRGSTSLSLLCLTEKTFWSALGLRKILEKNPTQPLTFLLSDLAKNV